MMCKEIDSVLMQLLLLLLLLLLLPRVRSLLLGYSDEE
jgi:hypothetical protein